MAGSIKLVFFFRMFDSIGSCGVSGEVGNTHLA